MHPEMSLVLLTVLTGAGQGIFILMVALDALFSNSGALSPAYLPAAGITSVVFQAVGIVASTLHLGNPQRGWRAILMFRNSWLSREVITLSLSTGATVLYLVLLYYGASDTLRLAAGVFGVLAGTGFYIASSMVYASVTFIKEWSNGFTPANFLLFGITSGIGAGLSVLHFTDAAPSVRSGIAGLLVVLTVVSLVMKALSFRYNAKVYVPVNIKNAVGINDPNIKMMDMGTSYDHYNTKEYACRVPEAHISRSKTLVMLLAFLLPLMLWTVIASGLLGGFHHVLSTAAAALMIAGLVIERRLFFVQGNNLQNLYYANFRKTTARNPLLIRARKGTPVPMR